ncbi:MAG: glutamine cyclotransferase [Acidobacteria bacterium]|nr:MAG: glutamine cyclotransferase [Acidobacteriota bacterium]PIE89434.1 MAG: glutamine cyclotransferase [Acidobacteriota bacterium]
MRFPGSLIVILLLTGCSGADVKYFHVKINDSFPHDERSYVQGFEYHEGLFWETSGQYGKSFFSIWNPATGRKVQYKSIPEVFAEGMTRIGEKLYVLTWKAGVCYVYNLPDMQIEKKAGYKGEGWGLTNNGVYLIMSNGTDKLVFRDPVSFEKVKELAVTLNGKPLRFLNELEYCGESIWANVYLRKKIVEINPDTGKVLSVVDLSQLPLKQDRVDGEEVLNGIAFNKKTGALYVTGKYWARVYEVELVRDPEKN